MQEETEVLGENLRGQLWIENQIHIRLWPDWESNPGRIGERHGNNRCANPPTQIHCITYPLYYFCLQFTAQTLIFDIVAQDRYLIRILITVLSTKWDQAEEVETPTHDTPGFVWTFQ